ncbi:hypothetical protein [Sphingobium sp.]|uniref:hypothetical protein n=1 Tax=Sphingobium sp. TaxID=1912891 RepID=UPI003B3B8168
MKTIALSIASSALVLGASLTAMAATPASASVIESRDQPILLGRVVVEATPLPN